MRKGKKITNKNSIKNAESQDGSGFQGPAAALNKQHNPTNLSHSQSSDQGLRPHKIALTKEKKRTARIIELAPLPYDNRISIEQLRAIWNDDEETYTDDDLLFIRDWLYTMSEIIIDVINSPGFIAPVIPKTDCKAGKARIIDFTPEHPESNIHNNYPNEYAE